MRYRPRGIRAWILSVISSLLRFPTSQGFCRICGRDWNEILPLYVPFGSGGAVAGFCCDCFKTSSTAELFLAIRDVILSERYFLSYNELQGGRVFSQAKLAIQFYKGELKEKPFENPYFEKDPAQFPGDPTALPVASS